MTGESPRRMILVALAVCGVCSILVSTAAVVLKPLQQANKELDRQMNILSVAGLLEPDTDVNNIDKLFESIEPRVIDLSAGRFTDEIDAATFDQRRAARDPDLSIEIPKERDIATIGRRAKFATAYLVRDDDGRIEQLILPVHGYGLWSTMYAFMALEMDLNTVTGITFYEHGETPGLGGEISNPSWQVLWRGKLVYDDDGAPRLEVIKGRVDTSRTEALFQVDGLAGSTLTGNGVTNMVRYWFGEDAFGPFLANLREMGVN